MPASAGAYRTSLARTPSLLRGAGGASAIRSALVPCLARSSRFSAPRPSSIYGLFHPRCFSSHTTPLRFPTTAETKDYKFNHTMLRVKDPKASLHFYTEILGMDLIDEHDGGDFKLFFLAYANSPSANPNRAQREAILELTWNKGTENDSSFKYHNGNDEPQGFGHTCISVPDLEEACARFEKLGVEFKKRPQDGKMKTIAFIYDPDKYWVEIIPQHKKDV